MAGDTNSVLMEHLYEMVGLPGVSNGHTTRGDYTIETMEQMHHGLKK